MLQAHPDIKVLYASNDLQAAGGYVAAKGAGKEAAGKVLGDKKLESEGVAEKAAGKVQNAVGGVKDTLRDATKDIYGGDEYMTKLAETSVNAKAEDAD